MARPGELMTVAEAARYMGRSRVWVARLVDRGRLASVRPLHSLRRYIRVEDIDRYVARRDRIAAAGRE